MRLPKPSGYPVGARWEATGRDGSRAAIWLERIGSGLEFWNWEFCLSDGSGRQKDWGTTYKNCYNQVAYRLNGKPRFKRVK